LPLAEVLVRRFRLLLAPEAELSSTSIRKLLANPPICLGAFSRSPHKLWRHARSRGQRSWCSFS